MLAKLIFQDNTDQNQDYFRTNSLFQDFYRPEFFSLFMTFQHFAGSVGTVETAADRVYEHAAAVGILCGDAFLQLFVKIVIFNISILHQTFPLQHSTSTHPSTTVLLCRQINTYFITQRCYKFNKYEEI